jgi:hypothetical protein
MQGLIGVESRDHALAFAYRNRGAPAASSRCATRRRLAARRPYLERVPSHIRSAGAKHARASKISCGTPPRSEPAPPPLAGAQHTPPPCCPPRQHLALRAQENGFTLTLKYIDDQTPRQNNPGAACRPRAAQPSARRQWPWQAAAPRALQRAGGQWPLQPLSAGRARGRSGGWSGPARPRCWGWRSGRCSW